MNKDQAVNQTVQQLGAQVAQLMLELNTAQAELEELRQKPQEETK